MRLVSHAPRLRSLIQASSATWTSCPISICRDDSGASRSRITLTSVTSLYHRMAELARAGRAFAVATVVRTQGSTPQVVGAKLVVIGDDERGRAAGTLGGGCVEADAIGASREVLASGGHSLRA